MIALWREEPVLRRRSIYGAASFGAFAVFWTSAAFLLAGPILWAIHLLLAYGPQSALCAARKTGVADMGDGVVSAVVVAVTAVLAVPLVLLLLSPRGAARLLRFREEGDDRRFSASVMRWLAALSLAGVVLAGAAALLLDPCAQLR